MFIQTHPIDGDIARLRFTPGEAVLPAGRDALDEATAADTSPLARRLLRIPGIEGVALGRDDLTLRRAADAEWYILKPSVLGAIMEHYAMGEPVVADADTVALIDLLDSRIRPAVEAYGGEVLFRGFADGVLRLELIGGGGAQKRDMMTNIIMFHVEAVKEIVWEGVPTGPEIPENVFRGTPEGPEAEAIQKLLDEKVNPAVAAHGGRISLMDVADHVAYLRMEGGCQGCSASAVTLQQGVQNAILTEVPTIQGVVDVTDHLSGSNPYFS